MVAWMRRTGLTLAELLVALALLALLLAILMPELSAARRHVRSAMCRHNLRQIGGAFAAAGGQARRDEPGPTPYPDPRRWPAIPYDVVPNERLFVCPEDDCDDWNVLVALRYRAAWAQGHHWLRFVDGFRGPKGVISVRSRRGSEGGRGYTEFVCEEQWSLPCQFGSPYSNNDGVFRIRDPDADGRRSVKLTDYTCDIDNRAYLFEEPLFGVDDILRNHVGEEVDLPGFYTSYGINARVHTHHVPPNTVVLLDYESDEKDASFIARPDDRQTVKARLDRSGRHRGRVNVLFADQSVRAAWPEELYPDDSRRLWYPGLGATGAD